MFFGLALDDAARLSVQAILAPFRDRYPEAAWTPADSLHVTLIFLGSMTSDAVPVLAGTSLAVASGRSPVRAETGRGGGPRGRRDGVAWLEIDTGGAEIASLGSRLDQRLVAERVIAASSLHPGGLRPHVTVARRAGRDVVNALRQELDPAARAAWTVDRVVLYRSHLGRGPARYEEIASAPLLGRRDAEPAG